MPQCKKQSRRLARRIGAIFGDAGESSRSPATAGSLESLGQVTVE
jgi:hypothetical protein